MSVVKAFEKQLNMGDSEGLGLPAPEIEESFRTTEVPSAKSFSRDGAAWLEAALDPFHDTDLKRVSGLPDCHAGDSVIVPYRRTITFRKPAGFAAGDTDVHIAWLPQVDASDGSREVGVNLINSTFDGSVSTLLGTGTVCRFSGLTIWGVESGKSTFDLSTAAVDRDVQSFDIESVLFDNAGSVRTARVIGGGFEAKYTGPLINAKGTVTVYNFENGVDQYDLSVVDSSAPNTIVNQLRMDSFSLPPNSLEIASSLQSARTWDSSEGAYCVLRNQIDEAFPTTMAPKAVFGRAFDPDSSLAPLGMIDNRTFGVAPLVPGTALSTAYNHVPRAYNSMETSGAYFVGLPDDFELTVTLKLWVEIFPKSNDTLRPMATPSPLCDRKALLAYTDALTRLPAGVRIEENAHGDWWKKAWSAIKQSVRDVVPFGNQIVDLEEEIGRMRRQKKKSKAKNK